MLITIISIGNQPKPEIKNLIQNYTNRMPQHIKVNWRYLKHGMGDRNSSMKQEAESILRAIPKKNKIFLLDEHGTELSSPRLAKLLFSDSQDITVIIGGAYGVADEIKATADFTWSLGKLVYPHQIVRLILSEQIYRSYTINTGHPYHHR